MRASKTDPDLAPTAAWSRRVRWIGGLIQAAFAAFWLVRGSLVIGGHAADVLIAVFGAAVIGVFSYAIRAAAGTAPRPSSPAGKRIERDITIATVIEFAAAIALPITVTAAGHPDWVLPSIAITIGPLLLWLDHRVHIARYGPVGWALTVGPMILVAIMSGTALIATTGIAAGLLLLGSATAGFHDLAEVKRRADRPKTSNVAARSQRTYECHVVSEPRQHPESGTQRSSSAPTPAAGPCAPFEEPSHERCASAAIA